MLNKVTRGKVERAQRVLIYGVQGVGKSTFAAMAPDPVFLGADSGSGHLDVPRFPAPNTWADVVGCVKDYANSDHDYKTLVLDPIGWFEPLCYAHVCDLNGWNDIESPGYGKGYAAALNVWRLLVTDLERAWLRGSNICLVAHATIKPFNNPEGENFDRYVPMMHAGLSSVIQSWVDNVFFATYNVVVTNEHKGQRGDRVIKCNYAPAYDAKNRYGLPDILPLAWVDPSPAEPQIEALLSAHPVLAPKVRQAMRNASQVRMREILAELKKRCMLQAAS